MITSPFGLAATPEIQSLVREPPLFAKIIVEATIACGAGRPARLVLSGQGKGQQAGAEQYESRGGQCEEAAGNQILVTHDNTLRFARLIRID